MPSPQRKFDETVNPALSSAERERRQTAAWHGARRWSRNDSAQFLNDRSAALLAHCRRRRGDWPQHSLKFGRWLQAERPDLFARAHATLAAAPSDELRERLLPSELV